MTGFKASLQVGLVIFQVQLQAVLFFTLPIPDEGFQSGHFGKEVTIPCSQTVNADKVISIQWNKDGAPLVEWSKTSGLRLLKEGMLDRLDLDENLNLVVRDVEWDDGGEYVCDVSAQNITHSGQGSTMLIVQDKPEPPPGKPRLVAVSPYVMNVTWRNTEVDHNSPVYNYIVQIRDETQTWELARQLAVKTNKTSIDNLKPFTRYQVRASAVNRVGMGMPGENSDFASTKEAAPEGSPTIVQYYNMSSTAIHIEWLPPPADKMHGMLQGYKISIEKPTIETVVLQQRLKAWNFTDLKPYTFYKVTLVALNSVGGGPPASRLLKTAEGVPSKPRITDITNQTSTSMKVIWERPHHPNGALIGYEIHWYLNGTHRWHTLTEHMAPMMNFVITHMKPYTMYDVQVGAFTKAGTGAMCEIHKGLTDVMEPSVPKVINLTANTSASIRVEWTRPERFYKQIDMYKIQYRIELTPTFQEIQVISPNPDAKTQELVIPELSSNSMYIVRVAGATKSIFNDKKFYTSEFSEPRMVRLRAQRLPKFAPVEDQLSVL